MSEIKEDNYTPEMLGLIRSDPQLAEAAGLTDNWVPHPDLIKDGSYEWVTVYAVKLWESASSTYQKTEDKAASVLAWMSGGTGLVTAGAALSTLDGKNHWAVAVSMFPAVAVAAWACINLLKCRSANSLYPPPSVWESIGHTERFWPNGKYTSLTVWHKAITSLVSVSSRRAREIDNAMWYGGVSVSLLVCGLAFLGLRAIF